MRHIMNLTKFHLMEVHLGKTDKYKGCHRWSEHMFRVVGIHRQCIRVAGTYSYGSRSDPTTTRYGDYTIIQELETLAQTQGNKANLLFQGHGIRDQDWSRYHYTTTDAEVHPDIYEATGVSEGPYYDPKETGKQETGHLPRLFSWL